jgi:hypothetical protein
MRILLGVLIFLGAAAAADILGVMVDTPEPS